MINAESIKGFNNLTANRDMFKAFLNNFYNSWGLEARETFKPISVKYCKDSSGPYLRFDYKLYGEKQWLHVKGPTTWY